MAKRIILFSLMAGLASAPLAAWSGEPVEHPFRVEGDALFEPVDKALDRLVARKAQAETNHLCVIGQRLDDGSGQAWVYWQEGRAIILWEPAASGVADLAASRRFLRFGRDVVPARDKRLLAGSSYLVSEDWAKGLIAECKVQGSQHVIRKSDAAAAVKSEGGKS
jgi:hypothetical protein